MEHVCANEWCKRTFNVLPEDLELLDQLSPTIAGQKFPLPAATQCVDCRHRHRSMFCERILFYHRTSSLSGDKIVSLFSEQEPFPVYSIEEWWGDGWDDLEHGMKIDSKQLFFEQFNSLYRKVPKMATFNENCENCEYSSSAGSAKNCYYCHRAYRSEDMYYCETCTGYNSNLCDCLRCQRSQRLYECVQCITCMASSFLYRCADTSDSHFCSALRNCQNCLFCHNLHNRNYHIHNKPISKEEFQRVLKLTLDGSFKTLQKNLALWKKEIDETIWKDQNNLNSDNCRGDALLNCHNCYECYNCFNGVDCRYCWDLSPSEQCVSSMDLTRGGIGELLYNSVGLGGGNYRVICSIKCRKSSELICCWDCYNCKNCFGCTGLKCKQYCIFNKQYSQEQYETLVAELIKRMMKTGEWGALFPASMSPFGYNNSLAMELWPITEQEADIHGWPWKPYKHEVEAKKSIQAEALPDKIQETPDDILDWAIICSSSQKPFKVIKQELDFQRSLSQPIHREHPDARMERRRKMLNPYALYPRACAKCGKSIETSYPPETAAIVYCEACYLNAIY